MFTTDVCSLLNLEELFQDNNNIFFLPSLFSTGYERNNSHI